MATRAEVLRTQRGRSIVSLAAVVRRTGRALRSWVASGVIGSDPQIELSRATGARV